MTLPVADSSSSGNAEAADSVSVDFVTDDDLRTGLETDLRQMNECLAVGAYKTAQVLAGSILEALLVDHLGSVGYQPKGGKQTFDMHLGELLVAARDIGVIGGTTTDLGSVLKDFRNLIHPGRLVRLQEVVDGNTARISKDLVTIIIRDVAKAKANTYGYTANHIVRKIESDTSAAAIVGELLREAPPQELERLLVRTLPDRYLEISADNELRPDRSLPVLRRTYHAAMEIASEEIRTKAMARYVRVIKEEPEFEVLRYEEAFFRARDLKLIPDADARIAKAHLLDQIQRDFGPRLESALQGFGAAATRDELGSAAQSIIEFVVTRDTPDRRELAERALRDLWRSAVEPIRDAVPDCLISWFNGTGPVGWKRWLAGLCGSMGRFVVVEDDTDIDDLPF